MGGYLSGRGPYLNRKITVEESIVLSAFFMQKHRYLEPRHSGFLTWALYNGSSFTLRYYVYERLERLIIRYERFLMGEIKHVEHPIVIEKGSSNFKGNCHYFKCPKCNGRFSKLYLPPGALIFACRICYDLTYLSCQQSKKSYQF